MSIAAKLITVERVEFDDLKQQVRQVFILHGASKVESETLSESILAAERDGYYGHGLAMLPKYVASLKNGHIGIRRRPKIFRKTPSVVSIDADNGFSRVALNVGYDDILSAAEETGVCIATFYNGHHLGALGQDVEMFALRGAVALSMLTTQCRMAPWGGEKAILGTNPMAFASPRPNQEPIVWDQASSLVAYSDLRLAAKNKRLYDENIGVGPDKHPTNDPVKVLTENTLYPFGRHKGTALAMMVEVLAGAMTGAKLSIDNNPQEDLCTGSVPVGQFLMVLSPQKIRGHGFLEHLSPLLEGFLGNGSARMPGDGRLVRRAESLNSGIAVTSAQMQMLRTLQNG